MLTELTDVSGFLFIGDPHLASVAPGRRKDPDFAGTVLDKLEQAIALANAENLQPVILGDLFHREKDSGNALKTRLLRVFRKARKKPLCLVGNHDLEETDLTDDTALAVIAESGCLDLLQNGPFGLFDCEGVLVGLGSTPYGKEIPQDVSGLFSRAPDQVIWVTHADIQFGQPFPQSIKPFGIRGCDMVVNGHLHKEQPSILVDGTLWVNPGNITRVSVEALDHVPGVLRWTPLDGLLRIPLRYQPGSEVFDLRGRLTLNADTGELSVPSESEFVQQLKNLTQPKTQTGAILLAEELREVTRLEKVSNDALFLLFSLLPEVDPASLGIEPNDPTPPLSVSSESLL